MFSLGKLIFGLLALVACASSLDVAPVSVYRKSWSIDDDVWFVYSSNIEDQLKGHFLYMACTKAPHPVEVNCNVTFETITANKSEHKITCPVKILDTNHREPDPITIASTSNLVRLGKNRVILYYHIYRLNIEENKYYGWCQKFVIIDLTDCTIMMLPDIISDTDKTSVLANPIVYPNGFDIIVPQRSACNGINICRLSYDEQGRRIGSPVAFNTSSSQPSVGLVAPNSIDKGFFVSGPRISDWYVVAEHVSVAGFRTNLMEVAGPNVWAAVLDSRGHEMFAACVVRDGGKTFCLQFDASGKELLRTANFTIVKELFSILTIHNLAGGGMLVAIPECENNTLICKSLYVRKFNADGSMDGEGVNYTGLDLYCHERSLYISSSETSDKYCFYLMCTKTLQKPGGLFAEFISHCIKKE